jgi:virulence factor Mce-like protein
MSYFTVGALVLSAIVIFTYLGFSKDIPLVNPQFKLQAVFPSSNNIRTNSPVRVAGVNVGKVTAIERVAPGASAARVVMQIQEKGLPIHKDAVLKIRPRIFLEGNFFVDIQPGSPSAPVVDDGDTIPINQTSAPVQLDQILTALQSDTREDLKKLLQDLGDGLEGEGGKGYNRSIDFWKDAYRDSAIVNDATLGTAEHDLSGYVRDAGALAAALDRNAGALKSLITDFNTTARAFAVRDDQLQEAVAELPRTLRAAQPALAALNRAFPPLKRFVADLRPGVRSSGPTLDASLPFAKEVRGLLSAAELRGLSRDLRPVVPSLTSLSKRSVPLLEQNRLASSCNNEVVLPWSKQTIQDEAFPAVGPVFQDSLKGLPGLAGESRSGDANGQWFRVLVSGGTYVTPLGEGQMLLTDTPIGGVNPPPPAGGRSPLRNDVPCETQEAPDLRSRPGAPPAPSRKVNVPASGPGRALYDSYVKKAVKELRAEVKAKKLNLKVLSQAATRDTIAKVRANALRARRAGR